MQKLFPQIRLAVLTTSILAAPSVVFATDVQYTYSGETGGLVIGMHTTIPGYTDASFAVGEFNMTTSTAGWPSSLHTYCTDVGVLLANKDTYTPLALTDPAAQGINPNWVSGGIQNAAKIWYAFHNSASTDVQKAGLQLAIWESLYNMKLTYSDADFFSAGNSGFHIDSPDSGNIGLAVDYATGLLNNTSLAAAPSSVVWLKPVDSRSQGLLCDLPSSDIPPAVPDNGSTLLLFGFGIAAVVLASRQLQLKNA